MKQIPVMALKDFDHKGTKRITGQTFYMSETDYATWGGFVKIVPAEVVQPKRTKTGPKQATKGGYGYSKSQ